MSDKEAVHETERRDEKSRDEKSKAVLERKLRFAREEPDSIFIVPFAKPARFALVNMTRDADRLSVAIKRSAGFTLPFDAAKKLLEGFEKITAEMWEYAHRVAPRLHSFEIRRWRDLNDTKEEKLQLAHRRISYVIVPRTEEVGRIAMAVKIIENRNLELRQTASFEEIKEVVDGYCQILNDFDDFLKKTADTIGAEYRSPLGGKVESKDGKDAEKEKKKK